MNYPGDFQPSFSKKDIATLFLDITKHSHIGYACPVFHVDFIKEMMAALPVSPYVILAGMQVILIFLGMLIDPGGIIMITTPVFVPIVKMLGFDPVWFGILFIVNMEMGYLTPPFGFNLFYMKGIVPKGISMGDIYRSIVPFVMLQAVGLVLVIIFPQIALWAPSVLIR